MIARSSADPERASSDSFCLAASSHLATMPTSAGSREPPMAGLLLRRGAGGALRRGARVEFRHRDGDLVGDARILDVLARERAAVQELLQPAAGEDAEAARARAHRGERLERGDLLLAAEEVVRAQPVDAQQHRVHRRAGAAARELVQLVREPALHHVHLELLRRQPGPARQALQAGQHPPRLLLPERLR